MEKQIIDEENISQAILGISLCQKDLKKRDEAAKLAFNLAIFISDNCSSSYFKKEIYNCIKKVLSLYTDSLRAKRCEECRKELNNHGKRWCDDCYVIIKLKNEKQLLESENIKLKKEVDKKKDTTWFKDTPWAIGKETKYFLLFMLVPFILIGFIIGIEKFACYLSACK